MDCEKERQQEQNVLVLHCYKSPRLALAPKTEQAYRKIFGRGTGKAFQLIPFYNFMCIFHIPSSQSRPAGEPRACRSLACVCRAGECEVKRRESVLACLRL